ARGARDLHGLARGADRDLLRTAAGCASPRRRVALGDRAALPPRGRDPRRRPEEGSRPVRDASVARRDRERDLRAPPGLAHAAESLRERPRPRALRAHHGERPGDLVSPRRRAQAAGPLRIGIVSPYSFDVPGGVQFHIRDLAEALIARGHEVSVLAPAEDETPVPGYVTTAGRSIPVRYNGAVARMNFGPVAAARVRRWLRAGRFDLLHLHEPVTPSLGMLSLWIADGPIVATFHSA